MPSQRIIHAGTFGPEQTRTYVHLPFEVPPGSRQLQIEYSYSNRIGSSPQLSGGNTIDLGVFDARGIDYLDAGLRGWSGSERLSISIGEAAATPGYLAGPILPGRWHVMLGLYKIAPEGCAYHVEITISSESEQVVQTPALEIAHNSAAPKRAAPAPWLRGELHCHTWHSDGDDSPRSRVAMARERGLDFLAVTDHNTISSQIELAGLQNPGLILIRGVEVTTFKGHFNVWGIGDWVDFRVQQPADMAASIRFARERGAVTSCNHPKPFGPPWEYEDVGGYDCIEVWNGPWYTLNEAALAFWLRQLASGRRIPAIGGSDYHRKSQLAERPPRAPGTPTTWLYVLGTPDQRAILDAIRHGHISLSDAPDGPFLDLRAGDEFAALGGDALPRPATAQLAIRLRCADGVGQHLRILDQDGVLLEHVITEADALIQADLPIASSRFVRAELRDAAGTLRALTNPVYLDGD